MWDQFILKNKFDHLYSFVRNPQTSVQQVINTEYLEGLFHLPLTTQAYEEFLQMEDMCISLRKDVAFFWIVRANLDS